MRDVYYRLCGCQLLKALPSAGLEDSQGFYEVLYDVSES
jgi:hypothetical protein